MNMTMSEIIGRARHNLMSDIKLVDGQIEQKEQEIAAFRQRRVTLVAALDEVESGAAALRRAHQISEESQGHE